MSRILAWNVVAMILATGCVGAGGKEGAPALVRALPLESTTACPGGGIVLLFGVDDGDPSGTPRDGVLDDGEVDNPDRESPIICHGAVGQVGESGAVGPKGLACWDLDGDETFDPDSEDTDSDGVATAADCKGELGEPGQIGAAGNDGVNCWEAVGGQTVADCLGDDGQPGLACWDIDGDQIFDVPLEDKDADGVATNADCRGQQGVQGDRGLTGDPGEKGSDGLTALIETTVLAAGTGGCATGGITIDGGLDDDGDGDLDLLERDQQVTICNGARGDTGAPGGTGATGAAGFQLATDVVTVPSGQGGCTNGGTTIHFGLDDTTINGSLETAERQKSVTVCNGLKGDQGLQGATGDTGPQGPAGNNGSDGGTGPAGLSCWDRDGDRTFDAAEDINLDGVATIADCRIPMTLGPHGVTIDYTAGRFSITCNNLPCSAANPGFVVMPSINVGKRIVLAVTSNDHWFDDSTRVGGSSFVEEPFGTETGKAWGADRPFFLYAVNRDDSAAGLAFAISPNPVAATTPTQARLASRGNQSGTSEDGGFFLMTSIAPGVSDALRPALAIGSMRMTKNDDEEWRVTALDHLDGIGLFQEQRRFEMPTGQQGEDGSYAIEVEGADLPVLAGLYRYSIDRSGICRGALYLLPTSVDGVDTSPEVELELTLPYRVDGWGVSNEAFPIGNFSADASDTNHYLGHVVAGVGEYARIGFRATRERHPSGSEDGVESLVRSITNKQYTAATGYLEATFEYSCFDGTTE